MGREAPASRDLGKCQQPCPAVQAPRAKRLQSCGQFFSAGANVGATDNLEEEQVENLHSSKALALQQSSARTPARVKKRHMGLKIRFLLRTGTVQQGQRTAVSSASGGVPATVEAYSVPGTTPGTCAVVPGEPKHQVRRDHEQQMRPAQSFPWKHLCKTISSKPPVYMELPLDSSPQPGIQGA